MDVVHGKAATQVGWAHAPHDAHLPFLLSCWPFEIELDFPIRALEDAYGVRPYYLSGNVERLHEVLRPWLRDLAQTVWDVAPFEAGAAGQELLMDRFMLESATLWTHLWKLVADRTGRVEWTPPTVR